MDIGKGLESLIPNRPLPGDDEIKNTKQAPEIPIPIPADANEDFFVLKESGETETSDNNGKEISGDDIVFQIEVEKIVPNPNQPRRNFEEEALEELSRSIREFGILQPLVVSKTEKESEWGWSVTYELIAGERRLLAAKKIGLQTVPAIIRQTSGDREKLELAVIENIQRADLNPIEFARAVARLQDEFSLTQREIAARLGKSREVVANSIRLLSLPTEIQEALSDGRINASHGRLLLSIDDVPSREKIFKDILRDSLSVREVKRRARKNTTDASDKNSTKEQDVFFDPELGALQERLEEFLGTKVELKNSKNGGRLTINFYSPEELTAILDKLLKQNDSQLL